MFAANNTAEGVTGVRPLAQTTRPPCHKGVRLQRDQRRRIPQREQRREPCQTGPAGTGTLHLYVSLHMHSLMSTNKVVYFNVSCIKYLHREKWFFYLDTQEPQNLGFDKYTRICKIKHTYLLL